MTQNSDSLQEIENSLKESFRLSSYEARSYIELLRHGRESAKQIAMNAVVPMPRIYDTVESLMSKGFIVKQEEDYVPIPPKQALKGRTSQFELQFSQEQKHRKQAEERLLSLLQESTASFSSIKSKGLAGEISILKGFNTIANKFTELLENSSDILLVAKRAVEAKEVFVPILLEFAGKEKKGRMRIRIIAPKNARVTKQEAEEAKKANTEIRKTDHVIFDMMITDTDDVIIGVPDPLSDEINHAIAIWVRNHSFASSTRRAVEDIWKRAEKI